MFKVTSNTVKHFTFQEPWNGSINGLAKSL